MAKSTHKFNYDLSICMIVKNEEKYIERCLEALKPLRERINCELIITDTGSIDRTIEIINEYADKVIHFEWCNDFAKARNVGVEACSGRWFMTLDADEIFDESIVKIADFMNMKDRDKYDAGNMMMINYASDDENAEEKGRFGTS
ncbi:MAG: glycosyltransferase, partial [bacterium]